MKQNKFIITAIITACFLILGFALSIEAQEGSQDQNLVMMRLNRIDAGQYPDNFLNVTIIGKEGQSIDGLTKDNFLVIEDGKEQNVIRAAQDNEQRVGANIMLLIDTSGSMVEAMEDTKTAAKSFVENLSPQDKAAIMSFSNIFTLHADFTTDKELLKSAIDRLEPMGGTLLYVSTYSAIKHFDKVEEGNKAVIVLTDGMNTGPGSVEDCITSSHLYGVPIYTIGLGPEIDQTSLSRIAAESGGMYSYAPQSAELQKIYDSLAAQLKKQYWVHYKANPQKWPKTLSSVTVKLKDVQGSEGMESTLNYVVPIQWPKIIFIYIIIVIALLPFMYLLFRLFWKKMDMNPVTATKFSIIIIFILVIIWYIFLFARFVPEDLSLLYFALIGIGQLLLLIIPIKLLGK